MDCKPITKHAMGKQIELGALYDAINGTLHGGFSLWNMEDIDKKQKTITCDDAKLNISSSLEETRTNSDLDLSASVDVDFGFAKLEGSAKYLLDRSSSANEARVDITCIKTNQTRVIPMEMLMDSKYTKEVSANFPTVTHFVGEVEEGAIGNISFIKKCSSPEESKEISAALKGTFQSFQKLPSFESKAALKTKDFLKSEELQIKVDGPIEEAFSSYEDVLTVGLKLPKVLKAHKNTLSVKLFPISLLGKSAQVKIREVDNFLLQKLSSTLQEANFTTAQLSELEHHQYLKYFPDLKKQCSSFTESFNRCIACFKQTVSVELPQMKNGSIPLENPQKNLQNAISSLKKQISIAEVFTSQKQQEHQELSATIKDLESRNLRNFWEHRIETKSLLLDQVKIIINFARNGFGNDNHLLEKDLLQSLENELDETAELPATDPHELHELMKRKKTLELFCRSVEKIDHMKKHKTAKDYDFGFSSIKSSFSADSPEKLLEPCTGDLIMASRNKNITISSYNPEPPLKILVENIFGNVLRVSWELSEKELLPVVSLHIRWRPVEENGKNIIGSSWNNNKINVEKTFFDIWNNMKSYFYIGTKIEIQVATESILGMSPYSGSVFGNVEGTNEIAAIVDFLQRKNQFPSDNYGIRSGRYQYLETSEYLYLGCSHENYFFSSKRKGSFSGDDMDVVPEYKIEITAADPQSPDSVVVAFTGPNQCEKDNQINALFSYLLEAEVNDSHRILLVDKSWRLHYIDSTHVHKVRPFTKRFRGKTLYVLDFPSDKPLKMKHWPRILSTINCLFMVAEAETTSINWFNSFLPKMLLSMFSGELRQCLRTIFTSSHACTVPDQEPLKKLGWPMETGTYIQVNNSAHKIKPSVTEGQCQDKAWWDVMMEGQREVADMMFSMPSLPIYKHADN